VTQISKKNLKDSDLSLINGYKETISTESSKIKSYLTQISSTYSSNQCVTSPSVTPLSGYRLSYTEKLVKIPQSNNQRGPLYHVVVFDQHTKDIKYICCNETDTMYIYFNDNTPKLLKPDSKTLKPKYLTYITGGPGWGCGSSAFYLQYVQVLLSDEGVYKIQTKKVDEDTFLRLPTSSESCARYQESEKSTLKQIKADKKSGKKALDNIKKQRKKIEKTGNSNEKKSAQKTLEDAQKIYEQLEGIFNEANQLYKKPCTNKNQNSVNTMESYKKKSSELLSKMNGDKTSITNAESSVTITPANVIKKIKSDYNAVLAFKRNGSYLKAKFSSSSYSEELKKTIKDLVSKAKSDYKKAKTVKTNAEAQKIYDNIKEYRSTGEKAISSYKVDAEDGKNYKADAKASINTAKSINRKSYSVLIKYNPSLLASAPDQPVQGTDKTPELVSNYTKLEKEVNSFKKFDTKDAVANATDLLNKVKEFNEVTIPEGIKSCNEFETILKEVKSVLKQAKKAQKALSKKDKEKGASAKEKIDAASQKITLASQQYYEAKISEAISTIKNAKELSQAALTFASGSSDTALYTSATTANAKNRGDAIFKEIESLKKSASKSLKDVKDYNSASYKQFKTKVDTIFNSAKVCKKQCKKPASDADATKAITCLQEQKKNFEELIKTISSSITDLHNKAELKPINGVITIPDSKVKSISCSGNIVLIKFKEDVFINATKGTTIKGNSGCYDLNTKKKGPYSKVIESIEKNTHNVLRFTSQAASTVSSITVSGFSFISEPDSVIKKGSSITATLKAPSSYAGKSATVKVVSTTDQRAISEFTSTVKLGINTSISIKVEKKTVVNSAILQIYCDSTVVATSTKPFSINPSIYFISPKQFQKYFIEDILTVQFSSFDGAFSRLDRQISFINSNKKTVYTEKIYGSHDIRTYRVKSLPSEITTGNYTISINVNGAIIYSPTIYISRESRSFTQITFTSPSYGDSFKKGDTIPIKWSVKNDQVEEKFKLQLCTEDKFFCSNIKRDVLMNTKEYNYTVTTNIKSSKFFIKAKWSGGHETRSELFTLNNSKKCFKFNKIDVSKDENNVYSISVNFNKEKHCYLKKSDNFTITIVKVISNKQTKNERYALLTADKDEYTQQFTLSTGTASNVRFLVTTEKDPKGEVSQDFAVPLVGDFVFTIPKEIKLSCLSCPNPLSFSPGGQKVVSVLNDLHAIGAAFCVICAATSRGISDWGKRLAPKFDATDFQKKLADNLSKVGAKNETPEEIEREKKKYQDALSNIYLKSDFTVKCASCKISGNFKAYDLSTVALDIKTAKLQANLNYDLSFDITLSLTFSSIQTVQRFKVLPDFESELDKASEFAGVFIPLYGARVANAQSGLGEDDLASFDCTLALGVKLTFSIMGSITFRISSSGSLSFDAVIESDTNRDLTIIDKKKPTFSFEFVDAQITVKLILSLDATFKIEKKKVINLELTLTLARLTATTTFSFKGFEPIPSKVGNCSQNHQLEFKLDFDAITIVAKAYFFKFNANLSSNALFKQNLLTLCGLTFKK